jgi:N-methylhydantoinase A
VFRIGIDTGGTFTDIVALNETTGEIFTTKTPTTVHDPSIGVLEGIGKALALAGGGDLASISHGTTVATNALLEERFPGLGLVTTEGFRHILEIARQAVPKGYGNSYFWVKPDRIVPLHRVREVPERSSWQGAVIRPLDEAAATDVARWFARHGVTNIGISFIHAYANPAHEQRMRAILERECPGAHVSISSEVLPEYREYERTVTTLVDAFVKSRVAVYVGAIQDRLDERLGAGIPFYVMKSNGGVISAREVARQPITTILSGPAAGALGASAVAAAAGFERVLGADVGGTSTDVCLVSGFASAVTTETLLAGFPVKTPQIDIKSVGAGGGSIAWIDIDGSLQVGPQSAGAEPGPACYGRGGAEATVSDANLVLGRLGATRTLGGAITPDPALAAQAIARLAERLGGFDLHRLAEGIVRIMVARTVSSIREITIQRGHDPRDFALMAFGGAGGMHAIPTAEELGIARIIVPRFPGNFSALGVATSDIKHDAVRTQIAPFDDEALGALRAVFAELRAAAARQLQEDGFGPADTRWAHALDLRYVGQAFELNLPVELETLSAEGAARAFHARHLQTYGHANEGAAVELVNARLTAYGVVTKPPLARYRSSSRQLADARLEERPVYVDGRFAPCPVYERERLPEDARFDGPAVVEEFGSTTVVFPGWRARVDEFGNLCLERLA